MKAERRHELKQNSLVRGIETLPKVGKESGSKILLALVTALLIVVLVRFYLSNKSKKQVQLADQLANVRLKLGEMQSPMLLRMPLEESATARNRLLKDVENAVDDILSTSTDDKMIAQAKNMRSDVYLQVATIGNPPEATTRPDLALPRQPADLLDDAAKGYQEVLQIKSLPVAEAADARFGLGAVAEDKAQWDDARRHYQAVSADPNMSKAFKDFAGLRLSLLDKISGPVLIGEPMTCPADLVPTSEPAAAPATTPSSAPTTLPADVASPPTTLPTHPATDATSSPGPLTEPQSIPLHPATTTLTK